MYNTNRKTPFHSAAIKYYKVHDFMHTNVFVNASEKFELSIAGQKENNGLLYKF